MNSALILFTDIFNSGGIQAYNKHLCDALEREFQYTTFTAVTLYDLPENIKQTWPGIKIRHCGSSRLLFIRKATLFLKTIHCVCFQKPQLLICAHAGFAPFAKILRDVFGLRYIVLTHGIEVWNIKSELRREALKGADMVLAVSEYTKNRLIKYGISEGKIRILRDTVDTSIFYPRSPDRGLIDKLGIKNKRILLMVSRVSASEGYKGHDIMLEVMKRLGGEYVLVVAGSGDGLSCLEDKAEKAGITGKIRFLGSVASELLVDYYNLCDIFIMPSKGEGFGIVFLEAMACGKPVIGGNLDGSTEPLMNGKLGFMVDPDSVSEIIDTINLVSGSKEMRTDPVYLRGKVEEEFGVGSFNKKAAEIFKGIVGP